MQPRTILTGLLVIAVVASAAGATALPSAQPSDGDLLEQQRASGSEDAEDSGSSVDDPANFTRLYVEDRHIRLRLKPGESDTATITVENVDDEEATLDPHVSEATHRGRPIPDEWLTISSTSSTLAPEEEAEITVSVSVPEDVELGDYSLQLALTDEVITYPGQPPRPVHSVGIFADVWREPAVHVRSGRHLYTQVEAGERYTHEIVVENTGEEAVPLSPEFQADDRRTYPPRGEADRSWFDIDSPGEVGPGETATVEVTIAPPADAERGRYDAQLRLGIDDPNRDERDTHWQRIRLDFQVWEQPSEPFTTRFDVGESTEDVTLRLTPQPARYRATDDDPDTPSFDVVFVAPDGSTVDGQPVEVTDSGRVDLSGERRAPVTAGDGEYAVNHPTKEFVYRVEAPAAGEWTVRIMPRNTVGFNYEIARSTSGE